MSSDFALSAECYQVKPCAADAALLAILSPSRYDVLNMSIHEGVRQIYRSQMLSSCTDLLQNERVLKRIADHEVDGTIKVMHDADPSTRKQPEDMTPIELFHAINALKEKVEEQKRINAAVESEVEILHHANQRFQMESGAALTRLLFDEKKMPV
jgi:hypothetical protein